MPRALINGVNLYYEVTGRGFPLVWSHEFAGASQSWDAQVGFFSRRYQVITYNARGYPPPMSRRSPRPIRKSSPWKTCTGCCDA